MFKKHPGRRSKNPLLIFFRVILSLSMFALLLGGIYAAYTHFSGFDPLKIDPGSVINNLINASSSQELKAIFTTVKLNPLSSQSPKAESNLAFQFLLVTDSHNDNASLAKTISQAKTKGNLQFIIGLGDYTEVGTISELSLAKKEFDMAGLRYFLVPGDHDLWDGRNQGIAADNNLRQIFGPSYQSFTYQNFYFLLLDNSDNYQGISSDQFDWIGMELEKAKTEGVSGIFVFMHEPLYHPFSDRFMGKVESKLKVQAKTLIFQLAAYNVKKVFAGDTHYFSEYEDPESKLQMVTVGAVTSERNPQLPRLAIVSVFEDGSVKVEDIEIK